jgi:FkbM family methyltransferase
MEASPKPMEALEMYWRARPTLAHKYGENGTMLFDASTQMAHYRATTLLSKEPGTIAWLDLLPQGSVLYDVGANVGVYSIYAAMARRCSVHAFEPDGANFALLCRNVRLNGLSGLVTPYCLALSDTEGVGLLDCANGEGGASGHALRVGDGAASAKMAQGIYRIRGDRLTAAYGLPPPKAIKIDIDGLEHAVLSGFAGALDDSSLSTINVEVDTASPDHAGIAGLLEARGFRCDDTLSFVHRNGRNRNLIFFRA